MDEALPKHQAFVDELKRSNNKATIIYLEGKVSLLADVKRLCGEIKKRESSVDAVFLSSGYIPYDGRESRFKLLFDCEDSMTN